MPVEPLISVIIPVLNEEAALPGLLHSLKSEAEPHEVVVSDGGSSNSSVALATRSGAVVVEGPAGRGNQIARGAEKSRGDILLFLHADSTFPAGGLQRVRRMLAERPDAVGGNFRLVFDGETSFSKGLTRFYSLIRFFGYYYGDSGIFVRRAVYDAIGGMRPIPVMEDYEFVRRLERHGRTGCIVEPPLVTSSRRFHGRRASEIVYGWLKLHALFRLGVSPDRLAGMYRRQRPNRNSRHG